MIPVNQLDSRMANANLIFTIISLGTKQTFAFSLRIIRLKSEPLNNVSLKMNTRTWHDPILLIY